MRGQAKARATRSSAAVRRAGDDAAEEVRDEQVAYHILPPYPSLAMRLCVCKSSAFELFLLCSDSQGPFPLNELEGLDDDVTWLLVGPQADSETRRYRVMLFPWPPSMCVWVENPPLFPSPKAVRVLWKHWVGPSSPCSPAQVHDRAAA